MHLGVEPYKENDNSVTLAQEEFSKDLEPSGASLEVWAARQRPLSSEEIKLSRCKLGELRWLATVSRPVISARLARIASRTNPLQGSGIYCINDLVRIAMECQRATVLKYASPSRPSVSACGDFNGRVRSRGCKVHCGVMSLVGWPDAAFGGKSPGGERRLGIAIGLISSILKVRFRYPQ